MYICICIYVVLMNVEVTGKGVCRYIERRDAACVALMHAGPERGVQTHVYRHIDIDTCISIYMYIDIHKYMCVYMLR